MVMARLAADPWWTVVVGRVEVGAVVGGQLDVLDGPAFPVGQVVDPRAGEELQQVTAGMCVVQVVDLGQMAGWVGGNARLQ